MFFNRYEKAAGIAMNGVSGIEILPRAFNAARITENV
jgi:hypothetical protein